MRGLSGRSERSLVGATKNNWGIITGRDHKMVDEALKKKESLMLTRVEVAEIKKR